MSNADELARFLYDSQIAWEDEQRRKNPRFKRADHLFARHLGLRPTTYSELKAAKRVPKEEILHKLAKVLGDDVYRKAGRPELIGQAPRQDSEWKLRVMQQHIWERLDPTEQDRLIELAREMAEEKGEEGGDEIGYSTA